MLSSEQAEGGGGMVVPAIIAVVVGVASLGYILFRKLSVTRQRIEFETPQDRISAIYVDIQEDAIRSLYIRYDDGTITQVQKLEAA
jgi:hypothetical protein